jgi:hypothetical protein
VKLLKEVDDISGVCGLLKLAAHPEPAKNMSGLQLLIVARGASSVGILSSNIPFVDLLSWNWGLFKLSI